MQREEATKSRHHAGNSEAWRGMLELQACFISLLGHLEWEAFTGHLGLTPVT